MQVSVIKSINDVKDDVLAIAVFQPKEKQAIEFPKEVQEVTKFMRKEEFEAKQGQINVLSTLGKFKFSKILLYGLGEEKDFNLDFLRRFGGTAVRYAAGGKSASVAIALPYVKNTDEAAQAVAEGAILASYKCIKFKSKQEDYFEVKTTNIISKDTSKDGAGLNHGHILAHAQNYVRDINENPANIAGGPLIVLPYRLCGAGFYAC